MKQIICCCIFVFSCGCAKLIVLHNPETGQTVVCNPSNNTFWNPAAAAESCAKGFTKAGFKVMSDY